MSISEESVNLDAQTIALILGVIALVPVAYFLYDRYIKSPHKLDVHLGNVAFARMISPAQQRNEKLVLFLADLKIINSSNAPLTVKEVELRYKDGNIVKSAKVYSVPAGEIEGKDAVVMMNSQDRIIIAWDNLGPKITASNIIQPGGILRGSATFVLETPVDQAEKIEYLSLVVKDYSGNETIHTNKSQEGWHHSLRKGFSLVDAPARKSGDEIEWEGFEITTEKSA